MFAVKYRKRGTRQFWFLSDKGGSRLRVYACRFQERAHAEEFVAANAPENPEFEFKIVPFEQHAESRRR